MYPRLASLGGLAEGYPNADAAAFRLNEFGHQGLMHDETTGLIYNRARFRNSECFLQRDPLGYPDGLNTYAGYHVMLGSWDPSGLEHPSPDSTRHPTEYGYVEHYDPATQTIKYVNPNISTNICSENTESKSCPVPTQVDAIQESLVDLALEAMALDGETPDADMLKQIEKEAKHLAESLAIDIMTEMADNNFGPGGNWGNLLTLPTFGRMSNQCGAWQEATYDAYMDYAKAFTDKEKEQTPLFQIVPVIDAKKEGWIFNYTHNWNELYFRKTGAGQPKRDLDTWPSGGMNTFDSSAACKYKQ